MYRIQLRFLRSVRRNDAARLEWSSRAVSKSSPRVINAGDEQWEILVVVQSGEIRLGLEFRGLGNQGMGMENFHVKIQIEIKDH